MVKLKQLLGNSSYTMKANLWGQGIGIAVMLVTPNLLSVEEYAKVVFVSFLLSFSSLYDIGLTSVYNRMAPGLVGVQSKRLLVVESTLIRWLISMSIVFALIVSVVYFIKYENILESMLILFFVPMSLLIGFFLTRNIVAEKFDTYYFHSRFQSILKFLQLPFVYLFSIFGWFLSSFLLNFIMILRIFDRNIFKSKYDRSFINDHLREGVELSVKTFIWIQVLNFPRTFASINYTDEQIANYGLVNSMYQVVVSISIAMFVPITVKTFKLFSNSDRLAFYYIKKVLAKTIPLFVLASIALVFMVPELISLLYPKYKIENSIIYGYFATVALFPTFFVIGNILAAKKHNNVMSITMTLCIVIFGLLSGSTNQPEYALGFIVFFTNLILGYKIYLIKKKELYV